MLRKFLQILHRHPASPAPAETDQRDLSAKEIPAPSEGAPVISQSEPAAPFHQAALKYTLTAIGSLEAVCPTCSKALAKRPLRKTKCPHCGKLICVRTRPLDRQRVLVTEDQARQIEDEWANVHSVQFRDYLDASVVAREKQALIARLGPGVSETDAKWAVLNKQALDQAKNGDWGLYTNTKLSMAGLLEQSGDIGHAALTLFDVCYLDLNGPNNTGGMRDAELLKEFPPFSPRSGVLAPAVVEKLLELLNRIGWTEGDVQRKFIDRIVVLHRNMNLPLSPEEGWKRLRSDLYVDEE